MHDSYTYVFLLHTVWDNVFGESVVVLLTARHPMASRCGAS